MSSSWETDGSSHTVVPKQSFRDSLTSLDHLLTLRDTAGGWTQAGDEPGCGHIFPGGGGLEYIAPYAPPVEGGFVASL